MSEVLKKDSSQQAQNDWDILTKLSINTPTKKPRGTSTGFEQEAIAHKKNAENFFQQASQNQKDKLKTIGIRDPQDAGEYLHEKASWERQVDLMINSIDKNIMNDERRLAERGEWNGANPITGEFLDNANAIEDPTMRERWKEEFQLSQEGIITLSTIEAKAVSAIIKDELQIQDDKETNEEDIDPHSEEALKRDAINKWIATASSDATKKEELHKSIYYATLKRIIEKKAKERANTQTAKQQTSQKRGIFFTKH